MVFAQMLAEVGNQMLLSSTSEESIDDLYAQISKLSLQLAVQSELDALAKLVQEHQLLPIRRMTYNIRKLADNGERSDTRWSSLQKLKLPSLIFCTIAFPGLVTLPSDQFDWLLRNVEHYLQVRSLPLDWFVREQIRGVIARIPSHVKLAAFIESSCHLSWP